MSRAGYVAVDAESGPARPKARFTLALALVALGAVAVGRSAARRSPAALVGVASATSSSDRTADVELLVSSPYERRLGRPIGDGQYDFDYLVDVSQRTLLSLYPSTERAHWEVDGAQVSNVTSSEVEVAFANIGTHVVVVRFQNGDAKSFEVTAPSAANCGSSRTRSAAHFGAVFTLYALSDAEGQATFGPKFYSANWLVREHLFGAADRSCDHWHDDAGFANHHIGITWQFENALRAVDPTVAAHYWDYTLDERKLGEEWYLSKIFDEDWFGNIDSLSNDDHIVDQGRFAFTPFQEYVVPEASYADIVVALNGELHGPVHLMVGGLWGDDGDEWRRVAESEGDPDQFLLLSKFLWRQGFVRCPDVCSDDTPVSDCRCDCPDAIVERAGSAYELLNKAGVLELWSDDNVNDVFTDQPLTSPYNVTYDDLLDALRRRPLHERGVLRAHGAELAGPDSCRNSLSYWPGCSNNHTFTVEYPSPTFAPTVNPQNERRT
ncbi:hypothetical protein JL720_1447 [Aureococcus anophagefferens]|nr:hypothetical protein JL720_1447 [Aureococcus anophagefferens]